MILTLHFRHFLQLDRLGLQRLVFLPQLSNIMINSIMLRPWRRLLLVHFDSSQTSLDESALNLWQLIIIIISILVIVSLRVNI